MAIYLEQLFGTWGGLVFGHGLIKGPGRLKRVEGFIVGESTGEWGKDRWEIEKPGWPGLAPQCGGSPQRASL